MSQYVLTLQHMECSHSHARTHARTHAYNPPLPLYTHKQHALKALACAPTNIEVLVQYGLFLIDALDDYCRAESVFRRALEGMCERVVVGVGMYGYEE